MMGWDTFIYLMIASIVLSVVLAPKIAPTPPAAFEEFDFPQADEGTPQAVFFGDCWTEDWCVGTVADFNSEPIPSSSSGKK